MADANVATESGTVGNAADAVETRHSNRTVQKDSADYGEVSCANDSIVCRVGIAHQIHYEAATGSDAEVQAAAIHPEANAPHREQT